jgi:hypothetical protein
MKLREHIVPPLIVLQLLQENRKAWQIYVCFEGASQIRALNRISFSRILQSEQYRMPTGEVIRTIPKQHL